MSRLISKVLFLLALVEFELAEQIGITQVQLFNRLRLFVELFLKSLYFNCILLLARSELAQVLRTLLVVQLQLAF